MPKKNVVLGQLFDRYEREIIPGKAPKTQSYNLLCLKQMHKAIGAVTPKIIAQYRDGRTAKVRANREIS